MGLSTIMGHAGLSGYAIVGMIIFIAVFASIMVRLWLQSRTGRLEEAGSMPLDDGRPISAMVGAGLRPPAQDAKAAEPAANREEKP